MLIFSTLWTENTPMASYELLDGHMAPYDLPKKLDPLFHGDRGFHPLVGSWTKKTAYRQRVFFAVDLSS